MADRVDFWTDDGHSPINCEEFICALVRAKYRDGPNLSVEENEAIRIDRAEASRRFVEAAVSTGRLEPRGRDFLPIGDIPSRETYNPFDNLFFERESFLQFAKETWLVSLSDSESSLVSDASQAIRNRTYRGDKWTDAELRMLLNASKATGFTQKAEAEKYGVTRQRISALLKQAKDKFEAPAKASFFPTASTQIRKVKGNQY